MEFDATKAAVLNSLEILDSASDGEELEYVIIDNTPDNVRALTEGGFTLEEIKRADGNGLTEDYIDISMLGFDGCGAKWWHPKYGFMSERADLKTYDEWEPELERDTGDRVLDPDAHRQLAREGRLGERMDREAAMSLFLTNTVMMRVRPDEGGERDE